MAATTPGGTDSNWDSYRPIKMQTRCCSPLAMYVQAGQGVPRQHQPFLGLALLHHAWTMPLLSPWLPPSPGAGVPFPVSPCQGRSLGREAAPVPQCQPCPEGMPYSGTLITCPCGTSCTSHKEEGQKRGSERRSGADTNSSAGLGPAHIHSLPGAQLFSVLINA